MCATALVLAAVAVVASAAGTYASVQAANGQKASAMYERDIRRKQMDEARRTAEIQALDAENERTAEFNRLRSSAIASIGASGLGEHLSFFQGIDPEAQSAYLKDVRSIRLNMVEKKSTIADEVNVADYGYKIAKSNSSLSKLGAFADFAKTAASAFTMYSDTATPGKVTAGGKT